MGGDSQIKGKQAEFRIMSILMDKGLVVFIPVVDIEGVDCVVKNKKGNFYEIQIKSTTTTSEQSTNFGGLAVTPRKDYYFIFYIEKEKEFWVIPTLDFGNLWGKTTKEGKHKGKFNAYLGKPNKEKRKDLVKYQGSSGLKQLLS